MSKNAAVSDFMREAVREKASRELAALQQRTDALSGIAAARDGLSGIVSGLATAAPAVIAIANDAAVNLKLKKLRKIVEDAHVLATEIGDALGVDDHSATVAASRQAIIDALTNAGLDPATIVTSPGGDAQ